LLWAFVSVGSALAQAQAPAQPPAAQPAEPPIWTGSFGAGLALTSGNADTSNVNLTAKLTHDPRNPHKLMAEALYLFGSSEGETTVNRTAFSIRDDYSWTSRTSFFGQFRYLRDTFKAIEYLASPTAGIAYKLVDLPRTTFTIDAGFGVVWEGNTDLEGTTSGALTLGESFVHKFNDTSTFTHSAIGLWKTSDFDDALYTLTAGLAAAITQRTQLKVELLELYKSQPPIGIEKGDLSFITSVVYSF
jgi:putative salt-induced outer membrane protein YdiY